MLSPNNRPLRRLLMGCAWWLMSSWLVGCGFQTQTEITFIFQASNPAAFKEYWDGVKADFEAQNPDVKVNIEGLRFASNEGINRIEELIKQGKPPALARVTTRSLAEYVARGLAEPLDEYMTPAFRSQFEETLINEGFQLQGRVYGLPAAVSMRGFYYNKELFQRAGIANPPKNWDALRDAATKISQLSPETYGFGIQGKEQETSTYFYHFLWGNGGEVLSPDGTRATFNGARGIEALTFLQSLVEARATQPDPTQTTRPNLEDDFLKGKYGMVIGASGLASRLDKDKHGVIAVPYKTTPVALAVADTLILFRQADRKDLAWRFVEFMYQDKYRLDFVVRGGYIPEKKTVAADPQFSANPSVTFFAQQFSVARFEPVNTKNQEIGLVVTRELQAAYRKSKTPKAALDAAAKEINLLLGYSATAW